MQIRRLYVKNFQSIKELEIKLEENSCYHIIGDNNIGKSALLKAINAIVNNVSSRNVKNYIRDEEESFYIELEDFDYNIVRLSRGSEDYYSWKIDGEEGRLDSTAGKVPTEVVNFFNFYTDEKTKEVVNIRPPRAKLLFVDTTLGENYHILQKALRIEEFLAAIKLGDSKKREMRKDIQVLNDRIEDETVELNNLPDFGPLLKDMEIYEKAADEYASQIKQVKEVIELNCSIEKKEEFIKDKTFDFDRDYVKDLVEKIKLVQAVLSLHRTIQLKESSVKTKSFIIDQFSESKDIREKLKDALSNKSLLENISKLQNKVNVLEKSVIEKEEIVYYWKSMKAESLASNLKSAKTIVSEGKRLRDRIGIVKQKQDAYEKSEEERKDFMVTNKFCPVVLSMKDRKCPFSGSSLEELLTNT